MNKNSSLPYNYTYLQRCMAGSNTALLLSSLPGALIAEATH